MFSFQKPVLLLPTDPLTTFPSPDLLRDTQRTYAKLGKRPQPDKDTGIPPPFPPFTTREQVFQLSDYKQIDESAQKVLLMYRDSYYRKVYVIERKLA